MILSSGVGLHAAPIYSKASAPANVNPGVYRLPSQGICKAHRSELCGTVSELIVGETASCMFCLLAASWLSRFGSHLLAHWEGGALFKASPRALLTTWMMRN
jgi:hypothetical protein